MAEATVSLGAALIEGIWSMFSIAVPGFTFTFRQFWLGIFVCSLSLLVVKAIFGFGGGSSGDAPRTSSTNNPKISKDRRHDEF